MSRRKVDEAMPTGNCVFATAPMYAASLGRRRVLVAVRSFGDVCRKARTRTSRVGGAGRTHRRGTPRHSGSTAGGVRRCAIFATSSSPAFFWGDQSCCVDGHPRGCAVLRGSTHRDRDENFWSARAHLTTRDSGVLLMLCSTSSQLISPIVDVAVQPVLGESCLPSRVRCRL